MTTPVPSADSTDPARNTGLTVVLVTLAADVAGYFGLPVDNTTKLIIAGVLTVLTPAITALLIRLKAWAPASVARLQADALALVHEAQNENPPIVTNQAMSQVQAAEAHPGALGLTGLSGVDQTPTEQIQKQHGRHERS